MGGLEAETQNAFQDRSIGSVYVVRMIACGFRQPGESGIKAQRELLGGKLFGRKQWLGKYGQLQTVPGIAILTN